MGINGQMVMYLPPGDDDGRILTGDFDGDHQPDLVVQKKALVDTWQVFGQNGVRMATFELELSSRSTVVGDIDGDGKDELINNEAGELACYGRHRERFVVHGWPSGYEPGFAYDMDGDGVAEIIACHCELANRLMYDAEGSLKPQYVPQTADPRAMAAWQKKMSLPKGGIFYPKTGKFVEFAFPAADFSRNAITGNMGEIGCGDPDGDGKRQVFVVPSLGSMMLAFNADGSLARYEEFGQGTLSVNMVHTGHKDYLVLQLEKRLQVYP
jgi:hypothetical protein